MEVDHGSPCEEFFVIEMNSTIAQNLIVLMMFDGFTNRLTLFVTCIRRQALPWRQPLNRLKQTRFKAQTHAGFNDKCNQIVKSMIISFHSVATSSEHKI